MSTARRTALLALGVGGALVLAACDSSSTPTSGGASFASDDGIVTLEAPPDTDGTLTVERGSREDLPDPLRGAKSEVHVYELGPEGSEFDDPVTVTFTIPVDDLLLEPGEAPLAILAFEQPDGGYAAAPTTAVTRRGDTFTVSGETSHFSKAVAVVGGVQFRLAPEQFLQAVGESVTVNVLPTPTSPELEIDAFMPEPPADEAEAPIGDLPFSHKLTTWTTFAEFLSIERLVDEDTTWGEWLDRIQAQARANVTRVDAIRELSDPNAHLRWNSPDRVYGEAWREEFHRRRAALTDEQIDEELEDMQQNAADGAVDFGAAMFLEPVLSSQAARVTCLDASNGMVEDAFHASVILHDGAANLSPSNAVVIKPEQWDSVLGMDGATVEFGVLRVDVTVYGDAECSPAGDEGGTTAVSDLGATVEVTDPTGDFLAADDLASRGFENIEQDPPAGLDITNVHVTHTPGGSETIVTMSFAGDARAVDSDEGRSTEINVHFDTDGALSFSILYGQDSSFVSGAEGVDVTHEWLSNDTIRFTISGHAPAAGDAVRVSTFSRIAGDAGAIVQGDEARVDIGG